MRQAVFFDRDGTLMEEVGYCSDPTQVRLFPGVPGALRRLRGAGFLNIVVSNQSGIGRGFFTEAQYHAVQHELLRQIDSEPVGKSGATPGAALGESLIAASYFCADAPDVPSLRRKPAPGMLFEAAAEFGIDLVHSVMVGDKSSDIECAQRVGARSILVGTGYGLNQTCEPDFRASGITDAAAWILRHLLT
jgi:D-glycero-D-manno-heptose 1,7-bisphosphate phosphatase